MHSIFASKTATPFRDSRRASAFQPPIRSNSADSSQRAQVRPVSRSQVSYSRPSTALGTQADHPKSSGPGARNEKPGAGAVRASGGGHHVAAKRAAARLSRASSRQETHEVNLWKKRLRNQRVYLSRSDSTDSSLKAVQRRAQSARVTPAEPESAHARPASSMAALRSSSPGLCRDPQTADTLNEMHASGDRWPRAPRSKSALPLRGPEGALDSSRALSPIPGAAGRGLLLSSRAIDDGELSLFHRRVRDTSRRSSSVPPARTRRTSPLQVRAAELSQSGGATGSCALLSTRCDHRSRTRVEWGRCGASVCACVT